MNNLYDVLEICLRELENGADMESVLARHPDLASELRPILKASVNARMRSAAISDPSPDAVRRGRSKVLQHASEMREQKIAPPRRMLPIIQRLAISFTLTALFLASGTGLVRASSTALPGENLYPIKLTWENLRLFFAFDPVGHELLEHTFKNERLHEINELLAEGKHETIQFSGVFMDINGQTYVSGIRIVILDITILPTEPLLNGAAVTVTGRTNPEGFVDAESIELLPAGTIVPVGEPLEVETEHDQNGNNNGNDNVNENSNENNNDNGNGNDNDNVAGNENSNDDNNDNDNDNNNDNDKDNDNDNADDGGNENSNDDGGSNSNDDDSNSNDDDSGDDDDNSGSGGGGGGGGGDD